MDLKLKTMWPLAAASFVAFTSALCAAEGNQKGDDMMPPSGQGPDMTITPSANYKLRDPKGWFITGSVFYWNAHEDGLEFGITDEANSGNRTIHDGEMENLDFHWDVGFKLGLGYRFDHDGWDLYANWTHFNTTAHEDESSGNCQGGGHVFFPLFTDLVPADNMNQISASDVDAHWKLRLNLIDLELGRHFFVSKWLSVRPHMGLRAAWVKQHYDIDYSCLSNIDTDFHGSFVSDETEMTNKYTGLGVRGGFNTRWGLGSGWSIYGDAAISLLYGRFHVHYEEDGKVAFAASGSDVLDFEDSFHATRAITDLGLGLMYEHTFNKAKWHLAVSLGWEHHLFFSQNQLWRVFGQAGAGSQTFTHERGDLGTQGWTLSARFDF